MTDHVPIPSDRELVARTSGGSTAAWDELQARHVDAIQSLYRSRRRRHSGRATEAVFAQLRSDIVDDVSGDPAPGARSRRRGHRSADAEASAVRRRYGLRWSGDGLAGCALAPRVEHAPGSRVDVTAGGTLTAVRPPSTDEAGDGSWTLDRDHGGACRRPSQVTTDGGAVVGDDAFDDIGPAGGTVAYDQQIASTEDVLSLEASTTADELRLSSIGLSADIVP